MTGGDWLVGVGLRRNVHTFRLRAYVFGGVKRRLRVVIGTHIHEAQARIPSNLMDN